MAKDALAPREAPPATAGAADPPYNLAAEKAVLGAILFDNNAHQRIAEIVTAKDFYAPANQAIFAVIEAMIGAGRVADGVTLSEHFERDGLLQQIGGARYLTQLIESAAFAAEIIEYARIVRDNAIRRSLMEIGAGIVQSASSPDPLETGEQQISAAEKALFDLAQRGAAQGGFQAFNLALARSLQSATAASQAMGRISGVSTGLTSLDHKLGGLHKSDLIILAARPSMGKTALATNIAYLASKKCRREETPTGRKTVEGAVVGFFSLEMSAEQLATRVLADVSEVPSDKFKSGDLSRREYEAIRDAAREIEGLQLYVDEMGGISISQLAARARRLQRTHGLDLLIIDYLQLITPSGRNRNDGRVQEVTEITKSLKALAKELNIPIIALSQLSRQVEMREDKRPQLSDLRESGSIEQDADVVLFIYREAYYLERQQPSDDDPRFAEWKDKLTQKANRAEIIISKQRHGAIGKVEVGFNPSRVRFYDIDWRHGGSGGGDD